MTLANKSPVEVVSDYSSLFERLSKYLLALRKRNLAVQLAGADEFSRDLTQGDFESFQDELTAGMSLMNRAGFAGG